MRQFLLSALKIMISLALLYLALRKVNLFELASRIDLASLGWIALALAVLLLQILVGALRWCQVSAECGAPLTTRQSMRYNMIGTFFNQTLPSSIGGDAVRLWLLARSGAGWRTATYSIFVDRAIGLIALAIIIVASLPWSYDLIRDADGRKALLLVDFAALAAGAGFLLLGRLPWPFLKRWWANASFLRLFGDREPGDFQPGTRTRDRCTIRCWFMCSRLSSPGAWSKSIAAPVTFGQIVPAGAAGDADHHAADLDRGLGRCARPPWGWRSAMPGSIDQ